jgi:hypothetical protein
LNTGLAVLMRCKVEQAICRKRSEEYSIEKELYLIDSSTLNFVSNADEEVTRAFLLWDAVFSISTIIDNSSFKLLIPQIKPAQCAQIIRNYPMNGPGLKKPINGFVS